jgi:hypothetical protein
VTVTDFTTCRNCRTRHHNRCQGRNCPCLTCEAANRAIPDPMRVLVTCWCEAHYFNVPAELVRAGQTVSCGDDCHEGVNPETWCQRHNTWQAACCEGRNTEERAVPTDHREVAVGATLPPVFGTAVSSGN